MFKALDLISIFFDALFLKYGGKFVVIFSTYNNLQNIRTTIA